MVSEAMSTQTNAGKRAHSDTGTNTATHEVMNHTQNISITRFIYNVIQMIFTIQYRLVLNINQLELNQQLVRILALNTVLE